MFVSLSHRLTPSIGYDFMVIIVLSQHYTSTVYLPISESRYVYMHNKFYFYTTYYSAYHIKALRIKIHTFKIVEPTAF